MYMDVPMSRSTWMCESDESRMAQARFAAKAAPTNRSYKPLLQAAPTSRSHKPLLQAAFAVFDKKRGEPLGSSPFGSPLAADQVGLAAHCTLARYFVDELFGAVEEMGIVPPLGFQVCPRIFARVLLAVANEFTSTSAH